MRMRRGNASKRFDLPACVIIKHANPCGVAVADTPLAAYELAFATDPTSAFGGIIAFNRALDGAAAEAVIKQFVEVIIAPQFTARSTTDLARKANVRVLTVPLAGRAAMLIDFKRVGGGLLVQTPDDLNVTAAELKVVTKLAADAAAIAGFAVCLARGEIRQIQRHRVLRQWPDAGGRRGADEPGR